LVFGNILGASVAEIFPVNTLNIPVALVGAKVHLDNGIPPNCVISKLEIAEKFTPLNNWVAQFIPSFVVPLGSEKLVHVTFTCVVLESNGEDEYDKSTNEPVFIIGNDFVAGTFHTDVAILKINVFDVETYDSAVLGVNVGTNTPVPTLLDESIALM